MAEGWEGRWSSHCPSEEGGGALPVSQLPCTCAHSPLPWDCWRSQSDDHWLLCWLSQEGVVLGAPSCLHEGGPKHVVHSYMEGSPDVMCRQDVGAEMCVGVNSSPGKTPAPQPSSLCPAWPSGLGWPQGARKASPLWGAGRPSRLGPCSSALEVTFPGLLTHQDSQVDQGL